MEEKLRRASPAVDLILDGRMDSVDNGWAMDGLGWVRWQPFVVMIQTSATSP